MHTVSKYEVRCPRCDVSFPVDTRRCLHCGGATGPSVIELPEFQHSVVEEPEPSPSYAPAAAVDERGYAASPFQPETQPRFEAEEEEGSGRPSILRSASTIIWIALAILFSVMRVCSDG